MTGMAIEVRWLQNNDYPARLDRAVIGALSTNVDRVAEGLAVSEDSPASFDIIVSAGIAFIVGDDEADQGSYLVIVTADETVTVPATPGSPRTDLVVLRVNDAQATGDGGLGDDATIEVLSGTSTAPATAIPLALISRTASESAILDAAITDQRPGPGGALWGRTGTSAPSTSDRGVVGDIFIQHAG
jgi:hypothetical protein